MPPRLDERIPEKGFTHPDEALDVFLGWVADQGLTLYRHQEEAILEIFAGNHVVLDAPTGSGKSLVALALHFKTFAETGHTWYTAPIKALVSEKFFSLCGVFGPEFVGMMTGDGAVNRDAPILSCTAEILANLALREREDANVASVVMDEFHYYADRDRGMAWQIPLLTLPKTQFLLMSATLGDTTAIREDLEARTGRKVVEVRGAHRPVPLEFSYGLRPLHDEIGSLVREGKAPVYIVHFTQNAATEQAQALMSTDWCTKEEKKALQEATRGFRFASPFGPTVKRYVQHGIGLHHAGLLPRYRLLVERLAQQGLLKIICGTDTLGVGINVPIRTVLFTQLCKFDGEKVVILRVRDFKQIAGRAGRAGFDSIGYVVAQAPEHIIENRRIEQKFSDDPKKLRKATKAQPPTKGYKHWDELTFQQLVERPPEPLESRFAIDHGRLLTMMQHAEGKTGDARGGYTDLVALIDTCHALPHEKEQLRVKAATLLADLEGVGVVGHDGDRMELDPTLQRDFSLFHSLSLMLLDALASLDRQSESYAMDVVSWVEAILEDPRPVLFRQQDRARFERLQELKAAGVPYEDRITALEDITWPKPNAELIWAFFKDYATRHPWVSGENVHPKGVVRPMAETFTGFGEYVKELGLERSEGVLLRYLSEAYKALVQNVPEADRNLQLDELLAWLRALLGLVDSSLVTEWETMLRGKDAPAELARPADISVDKKKFFARIRAELHQLVRALSRRDWEEAAACVRGEEWGPERWDKADLGDVAFDHHARLGEHTRIEPDGPHRWKVRQRLLRVGADEEDEGWSVEGVVDLRADTNPEGPLVEVVAVGVG